MANQTDTAKKRTKHIWTDAQKETLIYEVSRVPRGQSIKPVLDKYGVSDSAFRSMRRRVQQRAKGKAAAQAVVAKAAPELIAGRIPVPKQEDFREATKSRKLAMLAEYRKLPKDQKKAWQEAHNATQAVITYYTVRHKSKVTNTGKHTPEELPALVAEYYSLPHTTGAKRDWLKEHDLNHQNMFDYRNKVRRMNLNGASDAISAVIPTVRQSRTTPHVPIAPTPSLQDGVNYLEIKRDMYNEIIEDLNRVLKGGR